MLEQIDPVQYSIRLLVPPGSALMTDLAADGLLGPLDAAAYTYRWAHPDPRMDDLQREVASIAEVGERLGEDPIATYYKIRAATLAATGAKQAELAGVAPYSVGAPPPRLTESWFC